MSENTGIYDSIIRNTAKKAASSPLIQEREGDYEKDGLLYCHLCNTPKQHILNLGGSHQYKVPCLCQCAEAKQNAEIERQKEAERKERIAVARKEAFPESTMQKWNFEADDKHNEKLSNIALKYVSNFGKMLEAGKGLIFYGDVGTGKTFAAACIVNGLIDKGYKCLMTSFPRIANTVTGMYQGKQEYFDSFNNYDLVVIDDLATERETDYMNEIVQMVIDTRYRAGLPTIITTNLTANELKSPADITKQRIYSRVLQMCLPVKVEGNDRRKNMLLDDYNEYKNLLGL